jgi:hypothetical protein
MQFHKGERINTIPYARQSSLDQPSQPMILCGMVPRPIGLYVCSKSQTAKFHTHPSSSEQLPWAVFDVYDPEIAKVSKREKKYIRVHEEKHRHRRRMLLPCFSCHVLHIVSLTEPGHYLLVEHLTQQRVRAQPSLLRS